MDEVVSELVAVDGRFDNVTSVLAQPDALLQWTAHSPAGSAVNAASVQSRPTIAAHWTTASSPGPSRAIRCAKSVRKAGRHGPRRLTPDAGPGDELHREERVACRDRHDLVNLRPPAIRARPCPTPDS